jgi:carbonic anhydrase
VAVPLSLAIALASKVEPAVGLVTAIIAGIVCAFFGGTPLAVSGPAAAMAVLIASNVEKFGLGGLLVIAFGAGLLQLLCGTLGLGKLIRFVPIPVIAGFTAGIGAIILIGQLPRAFGLPPASQGHVVDVLKHLVDMAEHMKPLVFGLCLSTVLIAKLLPKIRPSWPAPLFAVVIPSLVVALVGWDVPLIGEIPRSLPAPHLPALPQSGWGELLGAVFIVFSLASLESLLSCTAVDKLSKTRHDPDQELIGQGLGNMAVSLFGGIPVTGVIARSALNVRSGAHGRRSSIVHSLTLLAIVFLLAPIISRIPIAALAGLLISVALAMLNPKEFMQLARVSRGEAAIYLVTFATIVFVDLIAGVQAGILAALAIAVIQLGRMHLLLHRHGPFVPQRMSLSGPLTFLSSNKIELLEQHILESHQGSNVILDLSGVTSMDSSGASLLLGLIETLRARGRNLVIKGMVPPLHDMLMACDHERVAENVFAVTETEVAKILELDRANPRHRMIFGVERFRHEFRDKYQEIFNRLAETQNPHTLFITCSDSRINPNLITSTDPGELFIVRNVGNIIPRFGVDDTPAEGAAVEYSLGVLGVKEIVVCGHTGCGAMGTLFSSPNALADLPSVSKWLKDLHDIRKANPEITTPNEAARLNVLRQIENLKTYAVVQHKLAAGDLQIRGWIYDVANSELLEWTGEGTTFSPLGSRKGGTSTREMEIAIKGKAAVEG